jgi:DNA-binding Lrp family transcriptional regulator
VAAPGLDPVDAGLIARLQSGFPLCDCPLADVGHALGLAGDEVLERLRKLLAQGVLMRLGPLYRIDRAGGACLLAALEVPPARFATVAARVDAHLEVAQSERRAHRLNLWFALAAETREAVAACVRAIAAETGLPVQVFPEEREYARDEVPAGPATDRSLEIEPLDPVDHQLVAATQSGLPLVPQPYEAVGALVGISAREVQDRLASMLRRGLVRRIGAVADPARLGHAANGLGVWDVDDARVDALGPRVARAPGVTHCCRRTRSLPDWPYNLFVALHAPTRQEVERRWGHVTASVLGDACRSGDLLVRTQLLKDTGLRLAIP